MKLIVCALPLLLAGCVSNGVQPLQPMEVAIAPYSGIVAAAHTGTLTYEHNCLVFYDDAHGPPLMPIWPEGTIFNGTSLIFHRPGKADQPIVLNQEFVLSGKLMPWSAVPGSRAALFERQCGGIPFAVADVQPAN